MMYPGDSGPSAAPAVPVIFLWMIIFLMVMDDDEPRKGPGPSVAPVVTESVAPITTEVEAPDGR